MIHLTNSAPKVCTILPNFLVSRSIRHVTRIGYVLSMQQVVIKPKSLLLCSWVKHLTFHYKHEHFDAIIPFPPMPMALGFSLWGGLVECLQYSPRTVFAFLLVITMYGLLQFLKILAAAVHGRNVRVFLVYP